jgi:hypothetical protein
MSGSRCTTRIGSRASAITAESFSAMPSRRSASANTITPPSELIRPPSNAAVIFLPATAGNENGSNVSSVMAGVAEIEQVKRMASTPNPYAPSSLYATSANFKSEPS